MNKPATVSVACLVLMALAMSTSPPRCARAGSVAPTASMHDRRADHTSTVLRDGRVLVAGGMVENGVFLSSAEIYDPTTDQFLATGGMRSRRVGHSATLLPNGKVLIAGGWAGRRSEGGPGVVGTTEFFDSGRFSPGPSMNGARANHAAGLLPDGRLPRGGGTGDDER